jgi:hypothetical protein
VHQKGERGFVQHVSTFVPSRLVAQLVQAAFVAMEAAMDAGIQLEFALLCKLLGPRAAPMDEVVKCKSYREAVRLCWMRRRIRNLTYRQLAAECDLIHQHVGDFFNPDDAPKRRNLPFESIDAVEAILGNTAITQYKLYSSVEAAAQERQAA